MRFVCVATIVLATSAAHAQGEAPAPPADPAQPEKPAESDQPAEPSAEPAPDPAEERLRELTSENEELRERLEILEEDQRYLEERVEKLAPIAGKVTGYLDTGFFSVTGDGSGIRPDTGFVAFPEYATHGVPDSWLFMGDPLSTMVNSRGDPATTGPSRAITFDGIGARKSTFLINNLNIGLSADVGKRALFTAKVDLLPRGRDVADPDGLFLGDYVDVRLAYVEYRIPGERVKTSLFAGKFDSVVGFEYRSQEAPSRIEVTPSLICRYTCGYPIGVKARMLAFDEALGLNVAVTNGSQFTEGFAFHGEIDRNHFKTVSGRLSYQLFGIRDLEIGVSGTFGAQDQQMEDDVYQWMYGVDVHLHRQNLVIRGEFVQGKANGKSEAGEAPCGIAPCLTFKGAYGLVGYRVTNIIMPYARVDWRDALHESGASFVYISKLLRATPGIRLTLTENMIFKAEYTVNRELGRIPQFPNDVFTSSFVVKY